MDLVDLSVVGTTIRAADVSGNEVEVELFGWDQPAPETEIERPVDATVSGRTRELVFPPWTHTWITELGDDGSSLEERKFTNEQQSITLDSGRYNVRFTLDLPVVVTFDGSATIRRNAADQTILSFEHPTAVTVGFQSRVRYPMETITVPRSTEGVATAISHLSADHPSTGVKVTSPLFRRHPPRIEFGDEPEIPDSARERDSEAGIEICVPDSIESLLPVAPLAYYLDAEVTVGELERPLLRAPDVDLTYEFEAMPAFQFEVADLLRQVFMLDSLIEFEHQGADPRELDVVQTLPLDAKRVYRADVDERLRTYLSMPYERLEPILPPWHYRAYVEPAVRNARVLPYVLARVGQVLLPDAASRSPGEGEFDAVRDGDNVPFVGWVGDDPPENAFRARRRGYENALDYTVSGDDTARVVVVDNAPGTDPPADRISDIVRTCSSKSLDVSVVSNLSTAALRDRFGASTDYLHYVGEYDDGFVCTDGTLAPDDIPESNVRVVFADANGSVEACDALVERGSAAAVGRHDDGETLNRTGREAFLKLLGGGAVVDQAAEYARRFGDSGSDPVVVGDGIIQFATMDGVYPTGYEIEPLDGRQFKIVGHPLLPNGGFLWSPEFSHSASTLVGTTPQFVVSTSDLRSLLGSEKAFLICDGEIYWSTDSNGLYTLV